MPTGSRKEKESDFHLKKSLSNEGVCENRKKKKKNENRFIWFSKDVLDFFIFMCKSARLHVCMCTTCLPDDLRGWKRALAAWRLELGMVVSLHVNSGNWTQVLYKSTNCPWPLRFLFEGIKEEGLLLFLKYFYEKNDRSAGATQWYEFNGKF